MDESTFRDQLARDGFTEVLIRDMPADALLPDHQHAWDARLLVLAGDMQLSHAGGTQRYAAGQQFEVPRDQVHAEHYGAQGTRLLIGRRHPPAVAV